MFSTSKPVDEYGGNGNVLSSSGFVTGGAGFLSVSWTREWEFNGW